MQARAGIGACAACQVSRCEDTRIEASKQARVCELGQASNGGPTRSVAVFGPSYNFSILGDGVEPSGAERRSVVCVCVCVGVCALGIAGIVNSPKSACLCMTSGGASE